MLVHLNEKVRKTDATNEVRLEHLIKFIISEEILQLSVLTTNTDDPSVKPLPLLTIAGGHAFIKRLYIER